MLQLKSVQKFYGTTCAVDGMSLAANAGEITAVIGPNGAGKRRHSEWLPGSCGPIPDRSYGPTGH